MQDEPDSPELPQRLPTRELLLAQALDACITAERRVAGSAQAIMAQQPAWLRADLQSMMGLAGSLDSAAANATMSPEFRMAARARLMQHIGAESALEPVALLGPRLSALPSRNGHYPGSRRRSTWWRGSAGLLAAVLGVAATLTASASALPGEPLYDLKQAQEELSVRLAPDDQARALALLGRADARLDETARLLLQGRTDAALETTQRYGQVVVRATTTYVVTIDDSPEQAPGTLNLETRLTQQQEQLETILQSAPEPARADLRQALVTTERGRALVADPRPVERALGRASSDKSAVAAGVPTTTAEDSPTAVPTRRPAVVPQPPAPVVVAHATEQPVPETVVAQHEVTGRGQDGGARPQNSPNGGGRVQQPAKPVVTEDRHTDEVTNSPPLQAHDDDGSTSARGGDAVGRGGSTNGRGGTAPAQTDRPVVTQQNNATTARADADTNDGDNGRGRNDDAPQPVVAHQAVAPVTARDSGAGATSDNKPAGGANGGAANGGTAARTTPPQVASPAEKPNGGGRDNSDNGDNGDTARTTAPQVASPAEKPHVGGRDNSENGDTHATPPAPAAKVQATPAATPGRRGGDGSDINPRPTPVPGRTTAPDPRGGGDNGHGGD